MSTAIQLIQDALYLSGVLSLEFDTANATQESVGLRLLNGIIAETKIDGNMVPYDDYRTFDTEANKKEYEIDGLIELETLAYLMNGNVRFSIWRDSTSDFFGTPRAENVTGPPSEYYVKRRKGGSNIIFYFVPDQIYQMQMYGKFGFAGVAINEQLDDRFDDFYQKWLKYEIASEFCQQYNLEIPQNIAKKLAELRKEIFQMVGIDLTIQKSALSDRKQSPDFWWNANFGKNWTP